MKRILLVLLFFIYSSMAGAVTCGFSLSVDNVSTSLTDNFEFITLNATVTKTSNSGQCKTAILTFGKGNNSSNYERKLKNQSSSYIPYSLSTSKLGKKYLKDAEDANNSEVLKLRFSGNTATTTFYFVVDLRRSGVTAESGTFTDAVNVSVYRGGLGDEAAPEQTNAMSLVVGFPEQTSISLVDPGANFDENSIYRILDFGFLEEGDTKMIDLVVKSNTYYKVSVSSENGGRLLSKTKNPGKPWINYDFFINNSYRNISKSTNFPIEIFNGNTGTPQNGKRLSLKFRVKDVAKARAGYYSDILVFIISQN